MNQRPVVDLEIPAHSVVVIVDGHRPSAPPSPILERLSAFHAEPWDVNKPDESLARLHAALSAHRRVRVWMTHGNRKAVAAIASAARRHGCATAALLLANAPEMDLSDVSAEVVEFPRDAELRVSLTPMPFDKTGLEGPFDIIADVHGCADELMDLLELLGHAEGRVLRRHPEGRIPVLLGDLVDRGPDNVGAVDIAQALEGLGGLRVQGNHCVKAGKALTGRDVEIGPDLQTTIDDFSEISPADRIAVGEWLMSAPHHLMLDGGRLVVAHAGLIEKHHGRETPGAQSFALYGPLGKQASIEDYRSRGDRPPADEWAKDYRGSATVVHGHFVHAKPWIVRNVVAIDTGCVFGGRLTAYQWPERTFASVPARATHWQSWGMVEREDILAFAD